MSLTKEVSHIDISGKDSNNLHPLKTPLILMTLEVSHLDISGNDIKE